MRRIGRIVCFVLSFCLGIVALVGCGSGSEERVLLRGSTSVEPVMGQLIDKYLEGNSNVMIEMDCQGSGAGRTAAKEDTNGNVIGMVSAALTDAQKTENGIKNAYTLAIDVVAIIVHKDSPLSSLMQEEVFDIYTGAKTTHDGLDGQIAVVMRESTSGTREAFETIISKDGQSIRASGKILSSGVNIQNGTSGLLAVVAANKNAIGYASLSSVVGRTDVKILGIDGIATDSADYPVKRPFQYFTGSADITSATSAFLTWLRSDSAKAVVEGAGLIWGENALA